MRRQIWVSGMLLLAAGCSTDSGQRIKSGSEAVGQWQHFYQRDFPEARRLDYFYDQSHVYVNQGHVVGRWKVLGSPVQTTTLYVIDISCRDGTFTEKETVIIDAERRTRHLTPVERYANRPIKTGTSGDLFRQRFCH